MSQLTKKKVTFNLKAKAHQLWSDQQTFYVIQSVSKTIIMKLDTTTIQKILILNNLNHQTNKTITQKTLPNFVNSSITPNNPSQSEIKMFEQPKFTTSIRGYQINDSVQQSPKYGPFKIADPEQNPPKNVYEIESQMRRRNLYGNVTRFGQNQSLIKNTTSFIYEPKNTYKRESKISPNQAPLSSLKDKNHLQNVDNPYSLSERYQQDQPQHLIKSEQNSQTSKGFTCGSCCLIFLSLLILLILSGFLYLILTNQVQPAKHFVMGKAQSIGLWRPQLDVNKKQSYGSEENSHPVGRKGFQKSGMTQTSGQYQAQQLEQVKKTRKSSLTTNERAPSNVGTIKQASLQESTQSKTLNSKVPANTLPVTMPNNDLSKTSIKKTDTKSKESITPTQNEPKPKISQKTNNLSSVTQPNAQVQTQTFQSVAFQPEQNWGKTSGAQLIKPNQQIYPSKPILQNAENKKHSHRVQFVRHRLTKSS